MRRFLDWFRASAPGGNIAIDGLVRAAIAHLWFETIHPFEDGNGRIGRAICDLALAQDRQVPTRLYSLSRQLHENRARYYDQLNAAQRGDGQRRTAQSGGIDATNWVVWFAGEFEAACGKSAAIIETALDKASFWQSAPAMNERQKKSMQKLLDAGPDGFEGGMSAEKYGNLTGASKATATRDLTDLALRGVLRKTGQGRGTRYWLDAPEVGGAT